MTHDPGIAPVGEDGEDGEDALLAAGALVLGLGAIATAGALPVLGIALGAAAMTAATVLRLRGRRRGRKAAGWARALGVVGAVLGGMGVLGGVINALL